jgi:hypothetical protein
MGREYLADLKVFVIVARERNFSRAAALMGLSRSSLSHAMSALEARLGVRLLTRTTRSVSFPGYHLHCASSRQMPPALALIVETLCAEGNRSAS